MSELRQDPTTRNWVIVAPERQVRPHDQASPIREEARSKASCPFCPGLESQTPRELWRLDAPDGSWRVRVVPNKFPALTPDAGRGRQERDGFLAMPGHGHHEVIIESPRHDWDLATAIQPEVRAVLEAYRARYRALREAGDSALIVIFRNHGRGSGTSLQHPHSQILAAPVVPLQVRRRLDVARQHFDDLGTCLYAEVLDRELGDGRRVVTVGERVVGDVRCPPGQDRVRPPSPIRWSRSRLGQHARDGDNGAFADDDAAHRLGVCPRVCMTPNSRSGRGGRGASPAAALGTGASPAGGYGRAPAIRPMTRPARSGTTISSAGAAGRSRLPLVRCSIGIRYQTPGTGSVAGRSRLARTIVASMAGPLALDAACRCAYRRHSRYRLVFQYRRVRDDQEET